MALGEVKKLPSRKIIRKKLPFVSLKSTTEGFNFQNMDLDSVFGPADEDEMAFRGLNHFLDA